MLSLGTRVPSVSRDDSVYDDRSPLFSSLFCVKEVGELQTSQMSATFLQSFLQTFVNLGIVYMNSSSKCWIVFPA